MNMKRFRQVLAYIEKHPEEWNQTTSFLNSYFFPTRPKACCFGGRAREMFGNGEEIDGQEACVKYLGATVEESFWVYSSLRTLDDFRTFARRPYA